MGRTALFWAVRRGNATVIKLLLRAGADPNLADSFGDLPLAHAIGFRCTKMLLDAGADVKLLSKIKKLGETLLFHAFKSYLVC